MCVNADRLRSYVRAQLTAGELSDWTANLPRLQFTTTKGEDKPVVGQRMPGAGLS
jgi:hypothetical protein